MSLFFANFLGRIIIYSYMDSFYIVGGNRLEGEVVIDSAKNSLLPILAGCILVEGEVLLKNVPRYSDVLAMCKILEHLGGKTRFIKGEAGEDLYIDCRDLSYNDVPNELACTVRSSIFTLGPILGRMGTAKVSYPGGCDIGLRPIDIHLSGIKQLGCKVVDKNGYIYADGLKLKGEDVMLSFSSVGATENIMMLAVLAKGQTRIFNPAREPEIVDLQNFLNSCGASITGAGSNLIVINGVQKLHGTTYQAISDRIEAGTFMIAGAMCGKLEIKNVATHHNLELITKLSQTACKIERYNDRIIIENRGRPISFGEIETAVYPGFPTDLQAQMFALASVSDGYSLIIENLFESRFKHIGELLKMGADIRCKNGVCIVKGKEKIYGAEVTAPDLRGGAALVLAGLVAEGYTTINNIELIDRGYYRLEDKLSALGGDIKRIKCEKKVDNCS